MSAPTLSGRGGALVTARELAASLTQSCRFADDPAQARIVLVDGSGDWVADVQAALVSQPDHILLLDPSFADVPAVEALASRLAAGKTRLTISETAATNPAVAPWQDTFTDDIANITFDASGPQPVNRLLLDQLRLARTLGFAVDAIVDWQANDRAAMVTAHPAGGEDAQPLLRLAARTANRSHALHRIDAYIAGGICSLSLPLAGDARPAHASIMNADGERILPTIYEHAHRRSLRAILSGSPPGATLVDFVADLRTMEREAQ